MTLFKASRMPLLAGLLCLLLLGFATTSYGAVRFDVIGAPTEVINTGRSEVTGSVSLIVREPGTTGTAAGGAAQIGFIYTNPAMQIDNTALITTGDDQTEYSGIKLVFGGAFNSSNVQIVLVENFDLNGRCTGRITINLLPGTAVTNSQDFIRLEGVRGRIDASLAVTPGTDLFVDLQSINDPAANIFTPDRVRVAKSLDGMNIRITNDTFLLCFPTSGLAPGQERDHAITITEGFARAFVDSDAVNNDRVDSENQPLGDPTNSTQFLVWLEQIPASVSGIVWPETVSVDGTSGAWLSLITNSRTFSSTTGVASARYSFQAANQTDLSDILVETFHLTPEVVLKSNATAVGTIMAGVSLAPTDDALAGCPDPYDPGDDDEVDRPRFLQMFESDAVATNNPPDDPFLPYATIIRCNCYLLFTYVTADAGFNTGIAIANTTGDSEVFGDNHAADQLGNITFYFYDRAAGFVGSTVTTAEVTAGRSFVDLVSNILPTGVTAFSGYVIARADFQFCHGFAFIADDSFASIAHGYVANVIPDPAIKGLGGRRAAVAAGDSDNIPAGESLNN